MEIKRHLECMYRKACDSSSGSVIGGLNLLRLEMDDSSSSTSGSVSVDMDSLSPWGGQVWQPISS